jgi:acetyl esterase/lipase
VLRTSIRYGPHRSQVADLWRPEETQDVPVVVLIHGGFWRAIYTKVLMNGLAKSVNRRGWAALNIEYRRIGTLGGGGGWPNTFLDVAASIDHLATVTDVGLNLDKVVTCGHSAGGQLALWAAARNRPSESTLLAAQDVATQDVATKRVTVRAAVSLAGVVDLQEADRLGLGGDATAKLLGGHWEEQEERYRATSPAALVPLGVPQVLIHGLDDGVVPPSMSEQYQLRASEAGDEVRYVPIDGTDHRDLIDADGPAWAATLTELERLLS